MNNPVADVTSESLKSENEKLRNDVTHLRSKLQITSQKLESSQGELLTLYKELPIDVDFLFPDVNSPQPVFERLKSTKGSRLRGMRVADAVNWLTLLKEKSKTNRDCIILPDKFSIEVSSSQFSTRRNKKLMKCIKASKARYIVFFLSIWRKDVDNSGHANAILIDNEKRTIERFEPHGKCDCEFHEMAERHFAHFLGKYDIDYVYIDPHTICSETKGPQSLQKKLQTEGGYCTVWCTMYVHARLQNVNLAALKINADMCSYSPTSLLRNVTSYLNIADKVLNIQSDHQLLPAEQTELFEEAFNDMNDADYIFECNEPTLQAIVRTNTLKRLMDFAMLRRDEFNLHKAIDWACQYHRHDLLEYLDSLVTEGDDVMEKTLDQQVRNHCDTKIVSEQDVKLLKQLVCKVISRTRLDPKLLFLAIRDSPLKIVNILLVNEKAFEHLNLNSIDNEPSPVMACFQRTNLEEAEDILLHLWRSTINQPCNVDPETLKDAVRNWGTHERPPGKGGINATHIKTAIISKISTIEADKEKLKKNLHKLESINDN